MGRAAMTPIALLLASLITYRMARMLAWEEGPFSVFVKFRGRFDPDQRTWLGRGLNCPLCVGFWLALPITALFMPLDWSLIIAWWAVAGAQTVLQKQEHKR